MKKTYLISACLILTMLASSCNSDDKQVIDSAFITEHEWRLTNVILSSPVDLNRDGTASYDMTEEFKCIKDEHLRFFPESKSYMRDGFSFFGVGVNTISHIHHYECNTEGFGGLDTGGFKMIDQNTITLSHTGFGVGFHGSTNTYIYDNGQLIETKIDHYPTHYNEIEEYWENTEITIKYIYSK